MQRGIKWIVDRVAALALIILFTPVCVVVGLLVLSIDGRPILHREQRVGRGGRLFTILKFRSMSTSDGAGVAAEGDPRVTRFGRVLRRLRLDEMPQVLNLLRGDMSLVGPRPMLPAHVASMDPPDAARILSVRPGITGVSALAFIGDDAALAGVKDAEAVYLENLLPEKVALEAAYLSDWSLLQDLALLVETVATLLSARARRRSERRVRAMLARD